ncbi:MAG TPA: cytochrome P450 [Ktedonobacteraceae bacterium]|nr:cytochrome P450 [Ktedonobacteraceae bacterium]
MVQTSEPQQGAAPSLLQQLENPYQLYAALRERDEITFSPELDAWLVSRYDDVRSVLAQPDIFSSRDFTTFMGLSPAALEVLQQGYPLTLVAITSDGLEHRRRREPHAKGFSAAGVKAREQSVRALAQQLVDAFINDGHADLIAQFAYPLTVETILSVLGVPRDRMEEVKQWSRDMADLAFGTMRSDEHQVACARGYVAFQNYMAQLIAQRRVNPQNDELDALIHYQVAGAEPLSDAELINEAAGFLAAGHRSSLDGCSNALAILLQNPSLWKKLCDQPDLIPSFVEEVLRYESPVQTLFRVTAQEVEIRGVKVPEGARVVLLLGSANRDKQHFPDGHVFDAQRTPNHHIAFGHGVHFCIGAPLGRLELRVALETLTQRLPALQLTPGQQLALNPMMLLFRGYQALEVKW